MIRPTHLIRRTTSCLADLAFNAIATLGCRLADRWEAYQAGAQAAIRGDDLPFNVVDLVPADDELKSVRQAFADCVNGMEADAKAEALHPSLSRVLSDDNLARVLADWSVA